MNLSFAPAALADLKKIRAWIAEDDTSAADRVVARIRQTILMLEAFPLLGRPGLVQGTRQLSVAGLPYFVVYKLVSDTELVILAILHGRRKYP